MFNSQIVDRNNCQLCTSFWKCTSKPLNALLLMAPCPNFQYFLEPLLTAIEQNRKKQTEAA